MPKLVDIDVDETSGVDHPAHLEEGWLLMKSANLEAKVEELLKAGMVTCPDCGAKVPPGKKCAECGADMNYAVKKAGRRLASHRVKRLTSLRDTLDELIGEVSPSPNPEGGSDMGDAVQKTVPEDIKEFLDDSEASDEVRKSIEDAFAAPREVVVEKAAPVDEKEEMLKAVPQEVRDMLKAESDAREELASQLYDIQKAAGIADAIAKAKTWSHVGVDAGEFGPELQKLRELDPELATSIEAKFDGAQKVAEASDLFRSFGKSTSVGGDASTRLEAIARERMTKSEKSVTYEQAYADALATPEGMKLYAESTTKEVR